MSAMPFLRSSLPDTTHAPHEGACFLYVLPCAYEDLLKLGFSREPLERMEALHPRWFEFFDLDRAFLVEAERVRDARDLELALGHRLAEHRAPAPLTVRREAAGHSEWYRGAYDTLKAAAQALEREGHILHRPLRPWLHARLLQRREGLFAWAVELMTALGGEPAHLDEDALLALRHQVRDRLDAYAALDIPLDDRLPPALAQWHVRSSVR